MKLKNILLSGLSLVLVAALAIGGTVAYLQDDDSDVNVMTLGNVYIEQIEQERDENGALVDFTQAKPLYPYVGEVAWNDAKTNISGHEYNMFGEKLKNAQDKIVTVKNTGKSDAYVRTWIALEDPFTTSLLGVNVGGVGYTQSEWTTEMIDGVQFSVTSFTYDKALKPNEVSLPSLLQVYLKNTATNEDVALLGESYQILAFSQAVQTNGFADAKTALDTAFGAEHPWKNTVFVQSNDEAEILGALTSGKDVILNTDIVVIDDAAFDGKGSEVTLAGSGTGDYGYLAFLPEAGEDTTVSNLTVTGTGFVEVGHYGMGGGDYVVNNLKIENMTSTLANGDKGFVLGCGFAHYGNAVLNDCVMTGTTAKDGVMPVDLGCVNSTTTTIDGGKYGTVYCWSHAVVTVNGAEIDTLQAAPIKGTVTIKAGSHVGTINVVYGTSSSYATAARLAKLVIEDGATVDAIVYNGITYTVAEWNAYVASL